MGGKAARLANEAILTCLQMALASVARDLTVPLLAIRWHHFRSNLQKVKGRFAHPHTAGYGIFLRGRGAKLFRELYPLVNTQTPKSVGRP